MNIYDMLVLDWGVYYLFHAKGAMKGTVIGVVVALLSGGMI